MNKELPPVQGATEQTHKHERISDAEQRAFDLLIPKHEELAINPDDFGDKFSPAEIERDKQAVERKKARMEGLDSAFYKRARLLEAILAEQIELSEWFGKDAMTIIPSEYDDLFNGIDLTAEFEEEGTFRYMAMGVDVTSSGLQVSSKLDTIRKHIEDGTLTRMKYFRSERNDDPEPQVKMPQLLIGADARTINELANLWLAANAARQSGEATQEEKDELRQKAKEAQEKLTKHRASVLVLSELKAQLETFSQFAEKKGLTESVVKYKNLLKLVDKALEDRQISHLEERENDSDDVFRSIKEGLNSFVG